MAHEIAKELLPKMQYLYDTEDAIPNRSHRSLCIVDRTPLEANDSLNCEFPAIPEKTKSMPSIPIMTRPKNRKHMIQRLEIYKHHGTQTMYLPLPYYGAATTDVMCERRRTKQNNATSSIPDFTQSSLNQQHKNTKKRASTMTSASSAAHPQHKKRSKTVTLQKKRKGKKRPIPRIISPIMIDCDHHFISAHPQKQSKIDSLQVATPNRAKRSHSHPVDLKSPLSPSMTVSLKRDDEYLIECDGGFMFMSSTQRLKENNE
eukprot:288971_1